MKCIKINEDVVRVTEERAKELVDSGKAVYTTKSVWKQSGKLYRLDSLKDLKRVKR